MDIISWSWTHRPQAEYASQIVCVNCIWVLTFKVPANPSEDGFCYSACHWVHGRQHLTDGIVDLIFVLIIESFQSLEDTRITNPIPEVIQV